MRFNKYNESYEYLFYNCISTVASLTADSKRMKSNNLYLQYFISSSVLFCKDYFIFLLLIFTSFNPSFFLSLLILTSFLIFTYFLFLLLLVSWFLLLFLLVYSYLHFFLSYLENIRRYDSLCFLPQLSMLSWTLVDMKSTSDNGRMLTFEYENIRQI